MAKKWIRIAMIMYVMVMDMDNMTMMMAMDDMTMMIT